MDELEEMRRGDGKWRGHQKGKEMTVKRSRENSSGSLEKQSEG